MKIILTENLIDKLMEQSPEMTVQVLATCRELVRLDNDAIESYQLAPDAPPVLIDIVTDMKKRAIRSRRRRERAALRRQLQQHQAIAGANRVINVTDPSHTHDDLMQAAKRFCHDLRLALSEAYPDPQRLCHYYRYLVTNFAYLVRFERELTARMRSYGIKRPLLDRFPDKLSDLYIPTPTPGSRHAG